MKFKTYHVERLSRWEFFQMMKEILSFCDKHALGMPQAYTDKVEELRLAFDVYDVEVAQERRPTPHELLKAEDGRDYAIRKTYQLISYYTDYRFDAEKEAAAKRLKRIFKVFGTGSEIARTDQERKTAMIINLLQDLATDEAQQHIATLNLTEAVSSLESNNQTFYTEQLARHKQRAAYVTGVARDARLELQKQFMELMTLINSLAVVEGPEKYADLKQIISTVVKEYWAQAKQRTKKKEVKA